MKRHRLAIIGALLGLALGVAECMTTDDYAPMWLRAYRAGRQR